MTIILDGQASVRFYLHLRTTGQNELADEMADAWLIARMQKIIDGVEQQLGLR